jgi:hypothetical protein
LPLTYTFKPEHFCPVPLKQLVLAVDRQFHDEAATLVNLMQKQNWLGKLVQWIGEQGIENLSPCLIASKAAGMQEAWDKAREAA